MDSIKRVTNPPSQAVGAAGLGAALGVITAWLVGMLVDVPAEIAAAIGTLWTFLAGRFLAD